jgi:hypothetical protein
MNTDTDWLDLTDPRQHLSSAQTTIAPETTDINKAFDDIAALFEVYPEVKPDKKAHRKKGGKPR